MSSSADQPVSVAKAPFWAAALFFLAVAGLIGGLAIRPLGAAELLGLLACVASAAVFATIPHAIDFTRRSDAERARRSAASSERPPVSPTPAPELDPSLLSARIAAELEARIEAVWPDLEARLGRSVAAAVEGALAAAEEKRRAEVEAALAATTPPRALDADAVPASAPGAKPRLGRGLLGLMHGAGALGRPVAAPRSEEAGATEEAASAPTSPDDAAGDERADASRSAA